MDLAATASLLHVQALHTADDRPYVFENRWINLASVPDIVDVDLNEQSANEWLVKHAPFTHGDIAFTAASATVFEAEILGTERTSALFVIERLTWENETAITSARLAFAPGYRMQTVI
jgi:GntR family histidine utilization transcriptional repressor